MRSATMRGSPSTRPDAGAARGRRRRAGRRGAASDELTEPVGGRAGGSGGRRGRRPAWPRPRPVHAVDVEPHRRADGVRGETEIGQRPGLVAATRRVSPRAHRHVARLGGVRGHRDDRRPRDEELLAAPHRPVAARRRDRRSSRASRMAPADASASRGARPRAPAGRRWPPRDRALRRRRRREPPPDGGGDDRAIAERSSAPGCRPRSGSPGPAPRPRAQSSTPPASGGPTVRATTRPPSAIAHSRAARSARAVTTSRSPPRWPTVPPPPLRDLGGRNRSRRRVPGGRGPARS